MVKRLFIYSALFLISFVTEGKHSPYVNLDSNFKSLSLKNFLIGIEDPTGKRRIEDWIRSSNDFKSVSKIGTSSNTHWVKFTLSNTENVEKNLYLAVPFSDSTFLYTVNNKKIICLEKSGDFTGLEKRSNSTGQLVVHQFSISPLADQTYYLKLKSTTPISSQFKSFTLNGIKLYSEGGYKAVFEDSRIVHAFFYGAILIMLLYNFLIFITLRYESYFSYVVFIFIYIVFLSSNSGYLLELFWPSSTRFDLYIRFVSAPILIASYLIFGKLFLKTKTYVPKYDVVIKVLVVFYLLCVLFMFCGFWKTGRSMVIFVAIISFVFIILTAFKVYRKGYSPAGYFLFANALLLIGGIIYARQRFSFLVHTPVSQYAIQASSIVQLALFSIGLADRINLARKEVADQKLALVSLEKQQEIEKKTIIEEKNKELEVKVKERTATLVQKNQELIEAELLIREQNEELATINTGLEEMVQARTKELNIINQELENSNKELDLFIYRTAHDIRGPLARVLGLCHLGLLEVSEEVAIDYLKKLQLNAQSLNHIIARLSDVYQINTLEKKIELFNVHELVKEILKELTFFDGFEKMSFILQISRELDWNGDRKLLKLILINFIENGIKFRKIDSVEKGKIKISISVMEDKLVISVADNGIGISIDDLPVIFDMFSKAALKYKTAGLGLYIVRISVEKLSGNISVTENSEGNTEFKVELPYGISSV